MPLPQLIVALVVVYATHAAPAVGVAATPYWHTRSTRSCPFLSPNLYQIYTNTANYYTNHDYKHVGVVALPPTAAATDVGAAHGACVAAIAVDATSAMAMAVVVASAPR